MWVCSACMLHLSPFLFAAVPGPGFLLAARLFLILPRIALLRWLQRYCIFMTSRMLISGILVINEMLTFIDCGCRCTTRRILGCEKGLVENVLDMS